MTNQSHTELAAQARKAAAHLDRYSAPGTTNEFAQLMRQCAAALESPEQVQGAACKRCDGLKMIMVGQGATAFASKCPACAPDVAASPTAPAQDAQGECGTPRYCASVQRCTADDVRRAATPSPKAERVPEIIRLERHEFYASDLLRRCVRNLRKGRSEFFWSAISKSFGLGSTCSAALASWAGRDPDTGIVTKEGT